MFPPQNIYKRYYSVRLEFTSLHRLTGADQRILLSFKTPTYFNLAYSLMLTSKAGG
jgi:hypothetical protein